MRGSFQTRITALSSSVAVAQCVKPRKKARRARRPRQARDQPSLGRRQDERDWRELEQHEVLDLMHEEEVRRPIVEG
jgi:hypothetical protein